MNMSEKSFRSLKKSYVLINTDFSIRDVTDSVLGKLNMEREEILKMNVRELPINGNITPVFSEAGSVEFLLYEFDSKSIDMMRKDFLSTASHELKTPLTALKLQVQLAKKLFNSNVEKPLSPTKIKKFIDRANQDVARLSQIVDDMLLATVSKELENQDKMAWFNLEDFMEGFLGRAFDSFKDFKDRVQVSISSPEMVYWNPIQIEQILINLLSNAYRYGEDSLIKFSVTSGGGYVYLTVEDHGPGISKEQQKQIFNLFAKGETRQSGLGLGLYNCKKIVQAHAGKISLGNVDDKGTRIQICIPLKNESSVIDDSQMQLQLRSAGES
jgi:signal transduction histidine kinase